MLHCAAIAALVNFCLSLPAAKADPLLDEIVEFNGEIFFLSANVPAVVIGAVRNGETSVRGFGQRAGPSSPPPDGDTLLRIGSVTKAFARASARPYGRREQGAVRPTAYAACSRPCAIRGPQCSEDPVDRFGDACGRPSA
jgi:serine-type D-Ala-D-Ala carboxypeptidase/endopeptidase